MKTAPHPVWTTKPLAAVRRLRTTYHAVALFSGGLDSVLAIKTLEAQGLRVKCLHFVTPFFGKTDQVEHWQGIYGLDLDTIDMGEAFVRMLYARPEHGFGKTLNPCVDCKILMLREARRLMEVYGARFVISGEVLGQRPMSQRRDTLNIIRRESGLGDLLLRPLCAKVLPPTTPERNGWVDRMRLHGISGRARTEQLALARQYGMTEIPTPTGGCRLTERENARRYWPLLQHKPGGEVADFYLANVGRQAWVVTPDGPHWLCIGRHRADNEILESLAQPDDILFRLRDVPGPLGLARSWVPWTKAMQEDAAQWVASFAPHAVRLSGKDGSVAVEMRHGRVCDQADREFFVRPDRNTRFAWGEMPWETVRAAIHEEARIQAMQRRHK